MYICYSGSQKVVSRYSRSPPRRVDRCRVIKMMMWHLYTDNARVRAIVIAGALHKIPPWPLEEMLLDILPRIAGLMRPPTTNLQPDLSSLIPTDMPRPYLLCHGKTKPPAPIFWEMTLGIPPDKRKRHPVPHYHASRTSLVLSYFSLKKSARFMRSYLQV